MTESSKPGLSTRTIHGHSFKDAHGSPHTSAWRWNNLPAVQKSWTWLVPLGMTA